MPAHNDQTPDAFAAGYAAPMRARWSAPIGLAIRRFTPVVFPGAPPEATLGFTTEAGTVNPAGDDTATDGSHNSFHEIGYFQTEAGPASGPAPNPDPAAPYNNWGRLAASPLVVRLLGRPATMAEGAWAGAPDDQAAVGMASLLGHARAVAARLPAALAPASDGSLWTAVLAYMGFGAGDGGASATLNRYAARLAAVDEPARWGALIAAVLDDARARGPLGAAGVHGNPAYDALRVWEKLATGRMLAGATGGDVGWFATGYDPAGEAAAQRGVQNAAYARPVDAPPGWSPPAEGLGAAGALAFGAGLGAAYYWRAPLAAWLRRVLA